MTLEDAVKNYDLRVIDGNKWLVWSEKEWKVYTHKYRANNQYV